MCALTLCSLPCEHLPLSSPLPSLPHLLLPLPPRDPATFPPWTDPPLLPIPPFAPSKTHISTCPRSSFTSCPCLCVSLHVQWRGLAAKIGLVGGLKKTAGIMPNQTGGVPVRSSPKTTFACDSDFIQSPSTTSAAVICPHISDNVLISFRPQSIFKHISPICEAPWLIHMVMSVYCTFSITQALFRSSLSHFHFKKCLCGRQRWGCLLLHLLSACHCSSSCMCVCECAWACFWITEQQRGCRGWKLTQIKENSPQGHWGLTFSLPEFIF